MAEADPAERDSTRARLVTSALAFIRERGVSGWSLRQLAAYCGTTHSHLNYHFGSRERLLVEAMLELRRTTNLDLVPTRDDRPLSKEVTDAFAKESDEHHLDDFRAFYYVAGIALNDPSLNDFFTDFVSGWVDVPGATEQQQVQRRLALAAMRGLLLDLLTSGDREGVTRAIDELARLLESRSAN